MPRKAAFWFVLLGALCLTIGVLWTLRTAPPPGPKPWWWGKDAQFHVEVWEPGKDQATVAMTMPKKTVDALGAFGVKASISAGNYKVYIKDARAEVERLPRGQWLTLHEEDATIYVWLDEKGASPPVKPPRPLSAGTNWTPTR